jgi:hypothetical protein
MSGTCGNIDDSDEVKEQIAFADVILLNKIDLVTPEELDKLEARIRSMNAAAKIHRTQNSAAEIDTVLNLGGFNLDRALEVDPKFMEPEYPFEWAGIYSLKAGVGKLMFDIGPDPSMSLVILPVDASTREALQAVEMDAVVLRIDLERAIEVETTYVENGIDLGRGVPCAINLRRGVHGVNARLQFVQLFRSYQVDLVEQNDVGEGNLLFHLVGIIDVLPHMQGIDQRHDSIKPQLRLHLIIDKEGLSHRAGIGHAGCLDQNVIELVPALHQIAENTNQIAAHGAADAPVVHLENLFFGSDDKFLVYSNLTELVLDYGNAFAMLFREDAVQQCGLA